MTKKKIVILGGGPAALSAAWELSRHPDWRDHYAITVYQPGWRLGGKCATGRGPGNRIEEHGTHVFLGSYDTTFTVIKDVYAAREKYGIAPESPFASWEEAFHRIDFTVMADHGGPEGHGWQAWPIHFPRNRSEPGAGQPTPPMDTLRGMLGTAIEALLASPDDEPDPEEESERTDPEEPSESPAWQTRALEQVWGLFASVGTTEDGAAPRSLELLVEMLEHILSGLEHIESEGSPDLHRDLAMVEFALVVLRGMLADTWDAAAGGWDFGRVDHLDLREWMREHGASERCLRSSPIRFLYAGTFSNLCDGEGQGGLYAAGVALRAIFKMLSYKGSLVWQPRAGAGDTLIAPLYQVLEARGVEFEFFHRVERVQDSEDGQLQRIEVSRQARILEGPYRPLIPVRCEGGIVDGWPDRPLWDQLDPRDAAAIQAAGYHSECAGVAGERRVLERGVDFDHAILATPVATLRTLCPEIIARLPIWKSTVETVKTTATQSFQLWLEPDNPALGLDYERWGVPHEGANVITYANGFGAWTDTSTTLPFEEWGAFESSKPKPAPRSVAYFCGAMEADEGFDEADAAAVAVATAEVRARAEQWSTVNMGWLFPEAATPEDPCGLDYGLLAVPPGLPDATHADRWRAQYFRANVQPTERYTLTIPGSFAGRVRFDQTGFDNLLLCGDWVAHDGINSGFLDGAMFCGVQAGRAQRARLGLANPDPLPVDPDILTQLMQAAADEEP